MGSSQSEMKGTGLLESDFHQIHLTNILLKSTTTLQNNKTHPIENRTLLVFTMLEHIHYVISKMKGTHIFFSIREFPNNEQEHHVCNDVLQHDSCHDFTDPCLPTTLYETVSCSTMKIVHV